MNTKDNYVEDSKYHFDNGRIEPKEYWNYVDLDILEINKVYSPMFDKTFDVMTPDEQKQQLDLWVESGDINDMVEYPFRKKLTKKQRDDNYRKFVGKKR